MPLKFIRTLITINTTGYQNKKQTQLMSIPIFLNEVDTDEVPVVQIAG